MLKGFLILAAAGAVFAYLVFNFVADVEEEDPRAFSGLRSEQGLERYYSEDAAGDRVLDLDGVAQEEARKVWEQSPIRQELIENFPQFEAMRDLIHQQIKGGAFRDRLLKVLDEMESDYLSGSIDSVEAKRRLSNF